MKTDVSTTVRSDRIRRQSSMPLPKRRRTTRSQLSAALSAPPTVSSNAKLTQKCALIYTLQKIVALYKLPFFYHIFFSINTANFVYTWLTGH